MGVAAGSNTNFVASTQIEAAAKKAGLDDATTAALVEDYEAAQLRSLKAGLLAAALLALISLGFTQGAAARATNASTKARARSDMSNVADETDRLHGPAEPRIVNRSVSAPTSGPCATLPGSRSSAPSASLDT